MQVLLISDALARYLDVALINAAVGLVLLGLAAFAGRWLWKRRATETVEDVEQRYNQGLGARDAIHLMAVLLDKRDREGRIWAFAQNFMWFMLGSGLSFFTPELRQSLGLP